MQHAAVELSPAMFWWTLAALVVLLDYIYFKLRYTTKNGPPTWYGLPFIGFLPMFLLPSSVYQWIHPWFIWCTPNVFLTRVYGPWVIIREDVILEMQLDDHCTSRPAHPLFDFGAKILVNNDHWVFFDDGSPNCSNWRSTRRLCFIATYTLSRKEMEAKILQVVDLFLAEVEKHNGRDWDIKAELTFAKVQEAIYLTIGETMEKQDIRPAIEAVTFGLKNAGILIIFLQYIPLQVLQLICRILPKKLNPHFYCKVLATTVTRLANRRVTPSEQKGPKDFIEAVLLHRSDDEAQRFIREVAPAILVGTFHTSLQSFIFLLHCLAAYPEYQKRIMDEIDAIVGDGLPTVDQYNEMHFTKAFVVERYRILPPIGIITRRTVANTTLGGFDIPAGTNLAAMVATENCNAKYFPEPEKFLPERHLDDQGVFIENPDLDVFSRGRRSCVGRKFATVSNSLYLVRFLQHFEVRPPAASSIKLQKFSGHPVPEIQGQKLRFIRRPNAPPIRKVEVTTGFYQFVEECIEEANRN